MRVKSSTPPAVPGQSLRTVVKILGGEFYERFKLGFL